MKDLFYRTGAIRVDSNGPRSLDEDNRSVEAVAATETPARVMDWERWEIIDEVLLMEGLRMPVNNQVPLLDSHSRWNTSSVIGSFRGLRIDKNKLIGRATFSEAPEAESAWTKTREGHLTDFSVGYAIDKSEWIKEGESSKIGGKTFKGPMRVVTSWRVKEISSVPIGADEFAKARSDYQQQPEHKGVESMKMSKKLKAKLVARGLPEDASDQEAWDFLEDLDIDQNDGGRGAETGGNAGENNRTNVDIDAEKAEAQQAERARVTEIDAITDQFDYPQDKKREAISAGVTAESYRKTVNDWFIEKKQTEPDGGEGVGFQPARLMADARDKFRDAAVDAILMRSGSDFIVAEDQRAVGYDELMSFSLKDLARQALINAGERVPGNAMQLIGRALTTTDLPYIMANVANKSLFLGFEQAGETWSAWCDTGSVNDFKTHSSPRASETEDLEEIPEHGDYQYGSLDEAQEQYAIATYGKIFAITRQAVINDDLGALTRIPALHGESAARKIGDIAYAVLTANSAMGDGTALFDAAHNNVGTGGVVSVTTVGEANKDMALQKNIKNLATLNIEPLFFMGPHSIKTATETYFMSELLDVTSGSRQANIYAGKYTRVYDARLDQDSVTAYYFAGRKGRTVTVFFLNGVQAPYTESRAGWTVDGIEYKVRIDAGAKAMDWRWLYKNAGA